METWRHSWQRPAGAAGGGARHEVHGWHAEERWPRRKKAEGHSRDSEGSTRYVPKQALIEEHATEKKALTCEHETAKKARCLELTRP
jgi:hypothetical protein